MSRARTGTITSKQGQTKVEDSIDQLVQHISNNGHSALTDQLLSVIESRAIGKKDQISKMPTPEAARRMSVVDLERRKTTIIEDQGNLKNTVNGLIKDRVYDAVIKSLPPEKKPRRMSLFSPFSSSGSTEKQKNRARIYEKILNFALNRGDVDQVFDMLKPVVSYNKDGSLAKLYEPIKARLARNIVGRMDSEAKQGIGLEVSFGLIAGLVDIDEFDKIKDKVVKIAKEEGLTSGKFMVYNNILNEIASQNGDMEKTLMDDISSKDRDVQNVLLLNFTQDPQELIKSYSDFARSFTELCKKIGMVAVISEDKDNFVKDVIRRIIDEVPAGKGFLKNIIELRNQDAERVRADLVDINNVLTEDQRAEVNQYQEIVTQQRGGEKKEIHHHSDTPSASPKEPNAEAQEAALDNQFCK